MTDAASFDAILQANLLDVFCEALGASVLVWDRHDYLAFASASLLNFLPLREADLAPGQRSRDFFGRLYDAGCRFASSGAGPSLARSREEWVAERVACSWRERIDTIEELGPDKHVRLIGRRFSSGLGFTVMQDISEHQKKEKHWRIEQERVRLTEDILDTLPVPVAIKDRNLSYVAVNREFCRLQAREPDDILGRSDWDLVEPESAAIFEEADWHLLASGEDRNGLMRILRPSGAPVDVQHAARRIGRPGQHYISLVFSPLGDLAPKILTESETLQVKAPAPPRETSSDGPIRKIVLVSDDERLAELPVAAASLGIELCILRDEAEVTRFLPAAAQAGLCIDRICFFGSNEALKAIASQSDIETIALAQDVRSFSGILNQVVQRIGPVPTAEERSRRRVEKPAPAPQPVMDALIIEDNPVNRMALVQICESLGLAQVAVETCAQACASLDQYSPRIVFADLSLPDIEPTGLVEALYAAAVTPVPVVIGITSGQEPRMIEACRQSGVADFLAKPLSLEIVEEMIGRYVLGLKDPSKSGTRTFEMALADG